MGNFYKFAEIDLIFDKEEAEVIYNSLSGFKQDLGFMDFEESWLKFGNGGLLLEYVYLINQGSTLKDRLIQQIKRIEEKVSVDKTDELEILRYVCLADVYNAKISYKTLISFLNLKTPKLYIDYFQKEYLLQYSDDREYLTGLHPIRSKILCDILFDSNNYIDIEDYINNSLEMISEQDMQNYLMESFMAGFSIDKCLNKLSVIKLKTWTGYNGILNALVWKGMYDYVFTINIEPISKLYNIFSSGWSTQLPFDFTNDEREGGLFGIFESFYNDSDFKENIKNIHKEFLSKEIVYSYLKEWLKNVNFLEAEVVLNSDVKSLGEVNFWISFLKFDIKTLFDHKEVLNKVKDQALKDCSVLLFGLKINNFDEKFVEAVERIFVDKLRKEYYILRLEISNEIKCEYLYNALDTETNSHEGRDAFNERSMSIIDLLRFAYPEKHKYSIRGLGLNFFDIEMPFDPTFKEIPISNLPNPLLIRINALLGNIYNYQFKPIGWSEYVDMVIEKRNYFLDLTNKLLKIFEEYFKTNNHLKFINNVSELKGKLVLNQPILFPKHISDKWGYISDGSNLNIYKNDGENKITYESLTSLRKYHKLRKYQKDFFTHLNTFISNIEKEATNIAKIRLSLDDGEDYNVNWSFYNLKGALKNILLFEREFVLLFSKFLDNSTQKKLNNQENKNLEILFNYWHQFYYKKGSLNKNIIKYSNLNFVRIKTDLNKRLLVERKKIFAETGFLFDMYLTEQIPNILILTSEITAQDFVFSLLEARELLKRTIHTSYTSAKSVFIESNIHQVVFIPFIKGKPIHRIGVELITHSLDKEISEAGMWCSATYKIDNLMTEFLELEFWNDLIPSIKDYEICLGYLTTLNEINKQINNIKLTFDEIDVIGQNILNDYKIELEELMNEKFTEVKKSWHSLNNKEYLGTVYFEVEKVLNDYLNNEPVDNTFLDQVVNQLDQNFRLYVENTIENLGLKTEN